MIKTKDCIHAAVMDGLYLLELRIEDGGCKDLSADLWDIHVGLFTANSKSLL